MLNNTENTCLFLQLFLETAINCSHFRLVVNFSVFVPHTYILSCFYPYLFFKLYLDYYRKYMNALCFQVLYHFISSNSEWMYQFLSSKEPFIDVEPTEAIVLPEKLQYIMFHVGSKPFDQVKNSLLSYSKHDFETVTMSLNKK